MITKLKTICIQTLLATNSGVNDSTETELQPTGYLSVHKL